MYFVFFDKDKYNACQEYPVPRHWYRKWRANQCAVRNYAPDGCEPRYKLTHYGRTYSILERDGNLMLLNGSA